jgi:cytohesin
MKHLLLTTIAGVVLVGCGRPPKDIWEAAKQGDIEAVKQYLDAGADVNAKGVGGYTSLHNAALKGHKEIVELLIAKGADLNAKGVGGITPLNYAVGKDHKEIVELLITKGADVNAIDAAGQTPLDWAVGGNYKETADLLRKHGGKTGEELSIHKAAEAGNIEAVKQHLAAGTDVDAKDMIGTTPLHLAAWEGHKEVVELLIANGADVNAKDKDGTTPLDRAIKDKKISDLLRNHGGKYSSIHIPSVAGNVEAVTEFLSNGADVNAKTKLGQTPLHMAAMFGRKDVVELLISKGADVNALTVSDPFKGEDVPAFAASAIREKTPLDLALLLPETADLLRKHGGKTGEELKAEGK